MGAIEQRASRRAFLRRAVCGLGGVALLPAILGGCDEQDSPPARDRSDASAPWTEEAFQQYLAYERERLQRAREDLQTLSRLSIEVVPDYDRTLETVLFTIREPGLAELLRSLVAALPAYTRIFIVGPAEAQAHAWQADLRASLGREVSILEARESAFVEVWGQDVVEHVSVAGRGALVLPLFYRYLNAQVSKSSPQQARTNVDGIGAALRQARLGRTFLSPVAFQGGDLAFDRLNGQRVLFTSGNSVIDTQRFYRQITGQPGQPEEILERLRLLFGVDRVEVLADEEARKLTVHIDQHCCIVPGRRALVAEVVEDPDTGPRLAAPAEISFEIRRAETIRERLRSLGYETVSLELTRAQLSYSQLPVNGIPYRDAETGDRVYLMPRWKDRTPTEAEIRERNAERIAALGFRVVPVDSKFYTGGGNLHCAANALT